MGNPDSAVTPVTKALPVSNPDCEHGGRWMARTMTRLNLKFLWTGRECHSVYKAERATVAPATIHVESMTLVWAISERRRAR